MRPSFAVIVISDGGPDLLPRFARALTESPPGRCALLLRERALPAAALLALACELRALTRRHAAALLISDRVDVALLADADGVHLPETGLSIAHARDLLGPLRLVGASRHDLAGVQAATGAGADYATLSPVYRSPGKGPPLGVTEFATIARSTALPLFALGGVDRGTVAELVQAGSAGVAVMREVMAAIDPGLALRDLLQALDAAPSGPLAPAPTGVD